MLSIVFLLCIYRYFLYFSKCVQEGTRQQTLVYWDSAIDMDDSNMSDSQDAADQMNEETLDANNLIVNYLPETTTQTDLQNMFKNFGEIESCRLIRHKTMGHSLGYGFVKFTNHSDAQAAIDRLNGLMMQNKKLKVSFARPANDPIKTANLYISGLKNVITEAELVGVFSPYGKVLTVKVMHNDNDPTKTSAIGFVRFEKHSNAQKAMDELNGKTPPINPGPIHVSFAKQAKDANQPALPVFPPQSISYEYNHSFPGSRFNSFGKTPSIMGGKNLRFDPMSRGNLVRGNLGDSMYSVNDGYPGESVAGHVLFVFNLAPEVEELHLWRLFGPFGAIRNVNIVMDKLSNRSKGFAFITMSNYSDAENAILQLHQTMLEGKVIQVSFKKSKKGLM